MNWVEKWITIKVIVPNPKDGQEHRKVALQWCFSEMPVHVVGTLKELFKSVVTDDERDGQANSAPERVTPADPVPEAKHIILGNAECGDRFLVRRKGDEVF